MGSGHFRLLICFVVALFDNCLLYRHFSANNHFLNALLS